MDDDNDDDDDDDDVLATEADTTIDALYESYPVKFNFKYLH